MDVFSGEVRLRTSDHFPDHISPFPSSFDSVFSGSEVRVSVPEINPFPPQKLRPIRCNAKSVVGFTDTEASLFPCSNEFRVVSGQSSLGVGFGELGFVNSLRDERAEVCGGFGAGGVSESEVRTVVDAEVEMEARIGDDEIEAQYLQAYSSGSSSESEVSGDLLENAEGSNNRKRRRMSKRLEGFMQKLVSKVLLKQETMYNQLMEMIERKERERLMREETWKQQEMERMTREEQVRAQETARNVALISFIHNTMGKDFRGEKTLLADNPSKDEGEVYHQRDEVFDGTVDRFPTSEKGILADSKFPPSRAIPVTIDNRRWLKSEVQALIQLRGNLEGNFCGPGSKCSVWDEVSARLLDMGYCRPAKKCKEKWENINKYFKRAKTSGITKHQNSKTCPYFQELNILYKQGDISPLRVPSDSN
ncbi:unnamed protein product [Rhodiola kirilowii]